MCSLLFRKETYLAFIAGATLITAPLLISYSQRTARLARAILDGREETTRKILTAHPDLLNMPERSNGFTPLHWAVIAGRTNLVLWLTEKGADVNAADKDSMTPLHRAAIFNRLTCAETLVAAGADGSAFGRKYGALRLAPIHLAAEEGHAEMIKFLLRRGCDVDLPTHGANHITALHMAAAKGRTAAVETLLAAGADINACDRAGKTPLAWAIESEQPEIANILRKVGAVP